MGKIVREHYPASKLPPELRGDIPAERQVTVTIVEEEEAPEAALSLDELFAMRQPPFLSAEEIDAKIARRRDEWDD